MPPQRDTVQRFIDLVATLDASEPIASCEITSRLGVSYRALHDCCQRQLGTSPQRYIRAQRLDAARAILDRPGAPYVTHVAADFGFEMSRFAAWYRERFGESPSQTRRRHHAV